MTYKTSLGKTAKAITVCVTSLIAIAIITQYTAIENTGHLTALIVLPLTYFIGFSLRPFPYTVTGKQLIIHQLFKNTNIERINIKRAGQMENQKILPCIRVLGTAGLFGYVGKFYNKSMGNMTWYATCQNKFVLAGTMDGKKIILTLNEPGSFVSRINKIKFGTN